MCKRTQYLVSVTLMMITTTVIAQPELNFPNSPGNEIVVIATQQDAVPIAEILKEWLEKTGNVVRIARNNEKNGIALVITDDSDLKIQGFKIKSDKNTITLGAATVKQLRFAVYTILEVWGFRKFSENVDYIPEEKTFHFPQNSNKTYKPSFEYRTMLYPGAYDAEFRDWHKLDWYKDDFGIWGHSFDILVPPSNFTTNPRLFALYEGTRRLESICMTNDTVLAIVIAKLAKIIREKPQATFFSVSQNDDVIFCECDECSKLNRTSGNPNGSLYYFLNRIAAKFPKIKIATLAYLHTYNPPEHISIAPNIYTFLCPISIDRAKPVAQNPGFEKILKKWGKVTKHLYIWDYTVQFSNYMSPFPNLKVGWQNYRTFNSNKVAGIFAQGYADVQGDFSELRQYLQAKLLWDVNINIEETVNDFLRGYYGKAAPFVSEYINLITATLKKSNVFLDIYSGPVQQRNTFLTPEAMDKYDQLLTNASAAIKENVEINKRIDKLRLALEFSYFEQSKFYGKDQHGMFVEGEGNTVVRIGLTDRVSKFARSAAAMGVYELSEGGLSPLQYEAEWKQIVGNQTNHLGEKANVNLLTEPSFEYQGKGAYGLADGVRGHNDFNINWVGWYGNNPEIEIDTEKIDFNTINLRFLEDQRHWIFPPKSFAIYGYTENDWQLIRNCELPDLTEDYIISIKSWETFDNIIRRFKKIKIVVLNHKAVPSWRMRKNKMPMVMLDEIELTKK